MSNKKKKILQVLMFISAISFILGLASYFSMVKFFPGSEEGFWVFPLLIFIFTFLIEKLYAVVTRIFLNKRGSLWAYFAIGYSIILLFKILVIAIDGIPSSVDVVYILKTLNSVSIEILVVNFVTFTFTLNLDYPKEICIDDYSVFSRDFSKENKNNIPATLKNKMVPASNFENEEYCDIFLAEQYNIKQDAEELCKIFIFKNNMQYELTGEYILSKVDFLNDSKSTAKLKYSMVFISAETTSYSLYFFDFWKTLKEKEHCRIDFIFEYKNRQKAPAFELSDMHVTML